MNKLLNCVGKNKIRFKCNKKNFNRKDIRNFKLNIYLHELLNEIMNEPLPEEEEPIAKMYEIDRQEFFLEMEEQCKLAKDNLNKNPNQIIRRRVREEGRAIKCIQD